MDKEKLLSTTKSHSDVMNELYPGCTSDGKVKTPKPRDAVQNALGTVQKTLPGEIKAGCEMKLRAVTTLGSIIWTKIGNPEHRSGHTGSAPVPNHTCLLNYHHNGQLRCLYVSPGTRTEMAETTPQCLVSSYNTGKFIIMPQLPFKV